MAAQKVHIAGSGTSIAEQCGICDQSLSSARSRVGSVLEFWLPE
jgi:hypothetical protein